MITGSAPCGNCSYYCKTILTGKTRPADDGGTWWEEAPNQYCPNCGRLFTEMHEPPKKQLVYELPVDKLVPVDKEKE